MTKTIPKDITASLRKLLNSHGHGFQYAVLRRLEQLHTDHKSKWIIDGVEFPVFAGGQTTHIDFILKGASGRTLLVVECKRSDPATANWCFVQAPYTARNPKTTEVIFEQFSWNELGLVTRVAIPAYANDPVCHLGFELRTGKSGDGVGGRNQTINDAVSQVLRGTSGLLNHLQESAIGQPKSIQLVRVIPLIITTAEIFITTADLGSADLHTGTLPAEAISTKKVTNVWFTHNRSPALKPTAPLTGRAKFNDLSSALRSEFARSIAIVNSEGIDDFMSWDLEEWLW